MIPPAPHAATPDWQLRVLHPENGSLYGAAVQVAPTYALTCAHVVRRAVVDAGPGSTVHLDAPRGGGAWKATGTVVPDGWWWEDAAPWDIAVLRLDQSAPGVPAAIASPHRTGDAIRFVGFPQSPAGRWITGRLVGDGGRYTEFTQIDTDSTAGITVVRGYSGSGVRPRDGDDLLGIVAESAGDGRVGWMVPMAAIPRVWPAGAPTPASPRARRTDTRAVSATARAVAGLRTMLVPDRRIDFFMGLDERLRLSLRADQDPYAFAHQLVSLAHSEYGVLRQVLVDLDERERGGASMTGVWEAAAPLLEPLQ